ncbi:NfeD family protein [Pseudomonas sp. CDFA 602]|uniref:NfeD family protein n=1 Tax=Pseudomonas californiensis TaxID=2829823 RepID=UPI001E585B51|nr:NfeD family protein [Pseudomonas californiensis]MCD5997318.1 NfeD family protein [Pseudomonas californiensis]MCD6002919.1 NfeD family protein [Pseudomonas californiensis]
MEIQGWYWIGLGFALSLLEIFTVTFFVLWFGIGAVLVGLISLVWTGMTLELQIFSWALLSSLLALLWFKVLKNRLPDKRWTAEEVIGEVGLLTQPVGEFTKGKVRFQKPVLGSEEWSCTSDSDIAVQSRVRLVSVDGNTVRVEKA